MHHYFDGKDAVFTAAFEIPVRPQDVVEPVLAPGPDGIGERLVRLFLTVWDSPPGRQRIVALLSASLTSQAAARMLREFLTREVFGRIVAALRADDPELRASLAASQMMGSWWPGTSSPSSRWPRSSRTMSSSSWVPRCRRTSPARYVPSTDRRPVRPLEPLAPVQPSGVFSSYDE